jgi:serine/threonine protein kinase
MTAMGVILGTAAYMAPEQARGRLVDTRADIWAFGVVLYEMLSGQHAFGGRPSVTDTLAAVMRDEPDMTALGADVPVVVRRLIERCLRKDPRIEKRGMMRTLHEQRAFADRFIAHMLVRNIRLEEDLVDQLFNSSEKRLARTLLLLARYGTDDATQQVLPRLSQETLAEMVGTTRSRVNFFMNKFRKLGFIEYNGLKINSSLLSIVLHD